MRTQSALLGAVGTAALVLLAPVAGAEPSTPPVPDPAGPVVAPEDAVVPHLASPENLPPGTSDLPTVPEGRGMSYLRDLWHAVQTQEVSGADALLLLTQRPMNPDSAPPGVPAAPQPPPAAPLPAPPAP